jgi:hypothetical protein
MLPLFLIINVQCIGASPRGIHDQVAQLSVSVSYSTEKHPKSCWDEDTMHALGLSGFPQSLFRELEFRILDSYTRCPKLVRRAHMEPLLPPQKPRRDSFCELLSPSFSYLFSQCLQVRTFPVSLLSRCQRS